MNTRQIVRIVTAASLAMTTPAFAHEADCPPQAWGPPLDALGPIPSSYESWEIAMTAHDSMRYPTTAWAVRVFSDITFDSGSSRPRDMVEVTRLDGRDDCNVFEIGDQWLEEIEPGETQRLIAMAQPQMGTVGQALANVELYSNADDMLALHGTRMLVEISGRDWRIRRGSVLYGAGDSLSQRFYELVAMVVPEGERPTAEWRMASR